MRKIFLLSMLALFLSSCCTLFTPSRQPITFIGSPGTNVYDFTKKIAEISEEGSTTVKIRKQLSSKTLIAKKEGYKQQPLELEATFNPIAVINLTNVIAWAIDLGTQKACKWENTIIEVNMEEK